MRSRPPSAFTVLSFLVLAAPSAWAQSTAGPEFRVNAYTTGAQSHASATPRSDGSWMVAWETVGEDGSSSAVWGKHYDRFGAVHGPDFQCNTYTTGFQGGPSITTGTHSGAVAWHSLTQDGSGAGIYAQRLTATHGMQGAEFRVNTYTLNYQYDPSVSMSPAGHFVVAWSSYSQDGSNDAVIVRRYDNLGQPITAEIRANTFTTGFQTNPSVAQDAAGNFVVVWQGGANQDGGRDGIFGQRFGPTGVRLGAEFRVNTYTLNYQQYPGVAMADNGRFVVVWQSLEQEGAGWGIYAQRYATDGTALGPEMHINGFTTNDQTVPVVGIDAEANFVIAWESFTQDGDQGGIFARRFDSLGNPRGAFRVNTTTLNDQFEPTIGIDRVGNFMVVWTGTGQDGSDRGVFAQRFGGLLPAPPNLAAPTVIVDPQGNGVFEPGETVAVQPAWENVSGAQVAFTGLMTEFTGPPPSQYIIVDDTASYGIAVPNAVQRCTFSNNCYVLTVTAPPVRPLTHWDASGLETLSPQDQGQVKRWKLHMGDSFADVPRTNGFYRFVETLLHTGVTGGCGGANYCPDNSVTRDTMAVFVLVAKEGTDFSPPACTVATQVFADVPPSSPFCKWIEELFRRGVVSGCNTNPLRYCPTLVTTRDQMAVFLLRTLDPSLNPPPCTTKPFEDVPIESPFCRWITELVARGITGGCGGGNYCPASTVTRGQMAVFLTTTFSLLLYGS
jgi:S-layer family protein